MECTVANKKQVKLDLVVNAAIVDMFEDSGRYYQRANFMAARGLKKLYTEALPKLKHKVWLTVNASTHTATLPLDFDTETFIGFVDTNWHKVPIKLNNKITDSRNIIDIPCEDKCPKCNQDTSICNDLITTEDSKIVVINDLPYNLTTVKKLYPNGDYYLETTTPVWDVDDEEVIYFPKKEFIVNFDLKPCGCLEDNAVNTANLIAHCPYVYCNHFAPCDDQCNTSVGGYRIFEETGLIQMDQSYPFDKVYVEYYGYIMKIQGQYYVPMVSFETLVEWTKWKLIQNRKNYSLAEREWQKQNYIRERRNMEKVLGRISLSQIIQAIAMIPKFDIDYGYGEYYGCFTPQSTITVPTTASNIAAVSSLCPPGSGTGSTIINNNYITINNNTGFTLAVQVDGQPGHPIAGLTTYQNNLLIGAFNINYIIVNNAVESLLLGDFTFDTVTGTITRGTNIWFTGDVLIINYDKNT